MTWGVPRRPKVSNKLGIPTPREGSDGDLQVRQTGIGARLFAKLGGRWFSNKLFGTEIDSPDVYIPRCWSVDILMPEVDSATVITNMPGYITEENILSGTIIIYTANNWILSPLNFSSASGGDAYKWECLFFMQPDNNQIKSIYLGSEFMTSGARDIRARVTIFFK